MSLSMNNLCFYTRPPYTKTQRTPTRARAPIHYARKARAGACIRTKHTDPVNYTGILSSATRGILVHEQPCCTVIHEQSLRYTHPHLHTHNTRTYVNRSKCVFVRCELCGVKCGPGMHAGDARGGVWLGWGGSAGRQAHVRGGGGAFWGPHWAANRPPHTPARETRGPAPRAP